MVIGFSGTRRGMTPKQRDALAALLRDAVVGNLARERGPAAEFLHGDCVGADAEAHALAKAAGIPVRIHPPANPKARAFCEGASATEPERPYLSRNRNIVAACDILVAAPSTESEVLRSGTWQAVRCARRMGREVVVLGP